jgi:hypothetical protein
MIKGLLFSSGVLYFKKNYMEKQTYQLLNVTGSESDIKTFYEREIINHTERTIDYKFIRSLYKSNECDNFLYYQSKICFDPESKNDIYMMILKQKIDGDLDEKLKNGRPSTNPFVTASFDDIKILLHESTCILIAIDCIKDSFPEVWMNYYLNEYNDLSFIVNKSTLSLNLPYFKRGRIIYFYECFTGNDEEDYLE